MSNVVSVNTIDRQYYRALAARDARFDGVFFVGVSTTGIYCRPICPARTPLAARCRFFASAAAAERRGFRPCLRCRPELASGRAHEPVAAVDIVRARALDAGARIASGALDHSALDVLAEQLGISSRHLRRVVEREFGASPVALAQTRRLLTAKQLLTETSLPLSTIAMASGFGSVRRFNALFKSRYRLSPGALRPVAMRSSASASAAHRVDAVRPRRAQSAITRALPVQEPAEIRLTLNARAPFHWSDMCTYLHTRAMAGVEAVSLGATPLYSRVVRYGTHVGVVTIGQRPAAESRRSSASSTVLNVWVSLSLLPVLVPVLARVRRMLDLDAAPEIISDHLRPAPLLHASVRVRPGMRVPGTMDGFELAVRAVLGQQVSVRGATTLAARLVATLCEQRSVHVAADHYMSATHAPSQTHYSRLTYEPLVAERLANASLEQLTRIGLPKARAHCLLSLAGAVANGELPELVDATGSSSSMAHFEERMTSLPGIGPWTAQYIAMRALRYPDAFPTGDIALQKAAGGVSASVLRRHAEAWRPWRAYAAMHLWSSLT